jgi:hypothetical protein
MAIISDIRWESRNCTKVPRTERFMDAIVREMRLDGKGDAIEMGSVSWGILQINA